MFLNDDEQASRAGDAAEAFEIPTVVRAATGNAPARPLDRFFDAAHPLLGVDPRLVPATAAPAERDRDPDAWIAPPRRETVRKAANQAGSGLDQVQQRRECDQATAPAATLNGRPFRLPRSCGRIEECHGAHRERAEEEPQE